MNIGEEGASGERAAEKFLKKNGLKIIKKNYYTKYGEIDIVAADGEFIVFCEVKTRKVSPLISGEDSVGEAKIARLKRAALMYIQETGCELQPRFDFISVEYADKKSTVVNYLKDAF